MRYLNGKMPMMQKATIILEIRRHSRSRDYVRKYDFKA